MPNDASATANLEEQLASNAIRMADLLNSQCNVEVTRSLVLCFSSSTESCAVAMTRALFAKGMRLLQAAPDEKADLRYHLRVGVKHSIREVVREDFVTDLVHTAAAMNGTYDGWNLLADEPAETSQEHTTTPAVQYSPLDEVPAGPQ